MGIENHTSGVGIEAHYPLQTQRFKTEFQELVYLFRERGLNLLQEAIRFVYNFIHRGFVKCDLDTYILTKIPFLVKIWLG
jgi:hypothetical protein